MYRLLWIVVATLLPSLLLAVGEPLPKSSITQDGRSGTPIATAFRAIEGTPGRMHLTVFGRLAFTPDGSDQEADGLPAFRYRRSPEADSPSVAETFGLEVPAGGLTAERLRRVTAAERLTHLVLSAKPAGVKLSVLQPAAALTALDVSGGPVSDADLEALAALRKLTSLNLTGCTIRDAGADALNDVLPPGAIDFGRPDDLGLAELTRLKRLTSLGLPAPATDDWVKAAADLPRLDTLRLSFTKVTDAGLRHLTEVKRLRALDLSYTRTTDAGLKELRDLPNLVALHLGHTAVTDAGLKELRRFPALATLHLSGCRVTAAGLKELRHLPSLTTLYLNGSTLSAESLRELSALPKLRSLDLSYSDVTDRTVRELQALAVLTRLDLSYTDLSDRGLRELAALKHLTRLRIDDTYASPEAEAELRAALPGCRVTAARVLR